MSYNQIINKLTAKTNKDDVASFTSIASDDTISYVVDGWLISAI